MPEKTHRKPKPAPGINEQWTADEEEIFAATRKQFALTQRELRRNIVAKALRLLTLGALLSTCVRLLADALLPARAPFIQVMVLCALVVTWLVVFQLADRARKAVQSNTRIGTENIKYVPPEADENTAE